MKQKEPKRENFKTEDEYFLALVKYQSYLAKQLKELAHKQAERVNEFLDKEAKKKIEYTVPEDSKKPASITYSNGDVPIRVFEMKLFLQEHKN